jgi:hypothetical protein
MVACQATPADVTPRAERVAHIVAMKDRVSDPPLLTPLRIADILALPRFPRAYTRSQLAVIAALEGQGVTVTGYLRRLVAAGDGDYHLELRATATGWCHTSWSRPRDLLITELSARIRARRPGYTLEALRPLCGARTPIRVSGWLFDDTPHTGEWFRSTPWEVHPVTRIEVCCWRELG